MVVEEEVVEEQQTEIILRKAGLADARMLACMEQRIFGYDLITPRQMRYLLKSKSSEVVVAMMDGAAVGYMVMLKRSGCSVARLYSLGVLPEARKKGVARALLQQCEQLAMASGCNRIHLEVHVNNQPGFMLYLLAGYSLHARKEHYYSDGGDALCLRKFCHEERVQ